MKRNYSTWLFERKSKNIEQVDNLGQLIQNQFHFYLITHVIFFKEACFKKSNEMQ
jgi:hypothetical protein